MISLPEIANRLTTLCEQHKFVDAYTELFNDDAISIDPVYKNEPLTGLVNLINREKQFLAGTEVHEVKISSPIFAGSYFSVNISMAFTRTGEEKKMLEELAVYKTDKGKIVSQQFFIG
jgi:hypothetical protein